MRHPAHIRALVASDERERRIAEVERQIGECNESMKDLTHEVEKLVGDAKKGYPGDDRHR